MFRRFLSYVTSAALVMGTMPTPLGAQPAPAPSPAPVAAAEQGQVETFSTAQLDALLAPIALYPDALLTQLLMATTYPLEIVAASRWLAQGTNKDLKGKALEDALKTQPWDPSVKSLVPFPQVLETLNQQLEWTQQLGFAMQVQQGEVFDAIQRLRAKAQAAGNLQSTPQQIVRTEPPPPPPPGATDPRRQDIIIEPAQPDVVYVPSYDPSQVFGAWPYADLPPVYFAPSPSYGYPSGAPGRRLGVRHRRCDRSRPVGLGPPELGCCWGGRYGGVNVNVNRWNSISPNRPWRGPNNGVWRPNNPGLRPGGGMNRPGGPVGRPAGPGVSAAAGHRAAARSACAPASVPGSACPALVICRSAAGRTGTGRELCRDAAGRARESARIARRSTGEPAGSAARRRPGTRPGIVRMCPRRAGRGIVQGVLPGVGPGNRPGAAGRRAGEPACGAARCATGNRPGCPRAQDRGNGRAGSQAWADRAATGRRSGQAAGRGARPAPPRRPPAIARGRSIETELPEVVGAAAAVAAAAAAVVAGVA